MNASILDNLKIAIDEHALENFFRKTYRWSEDWHARIIFGGSLFNVDLVPSIVDPSLFPSTIASALAVSFVAMMKDENGQHLLPY
jgi:hypothetical protein